MHGSAADGVVGLKVDAGSVASAKDIAVEIFRLAQVMNANGAVAEAFDVRHDVSSLFSRLKRFAKLAPRSQHRTPRRRLRQQRDPDYALYAQQLRKCPRSRCR